MERIPVANPDIGEAEANAVHEVVRSGWISMGRKVEEFESLARDFTGARHAVAMNNGTSTLHALLLALEIGAGDEVIVPSLTYISSVNAVIFTGADYVLCDSDPDTFNVDVHHVRELITERTKAIMPVDLKGMPVDYDGFAALADETGVAVIGDSAESLGAEYRGARVGTQVLAHSFSFFANKNVTTGEGGMVVTDDDALFEKLRIVRNQGQEGRYHHTHLGNNFRMTDVLAAIGVEQLPKLDAILSAKEEQAARYDELFSQTDHVATPTVPDYVTRHSWYNYSIKVDASIRDAVVQELEEQEIETRLSFPPVHGQPYHQDRFGHDAGAFPGAEAAARSFIDIPIFAGLRADQQERVAAEVIRICGEEGQG